MKRRVQTTSLGLALALSFGVLLQAQDAGNAPPPPPDEQSAAPADPQMNQDAPAPPPSRGWRRFGDPAPPQVADNGPAARPPQAPSQQYGRPDQPYDRPGSGGPDGNYGPGPAGAYDRPAYRPAPPQLVMPAGTWVTIRLNQPLSSDRNQPGDYFTGTLAQPIVANGYVVARRGQTISGRVAETVKAGHVKGTSRLVIEVTELTLVDGRQVPVSSQLVERRGDTSVGRDVGAIGATTGIGAAIGAAAAGGFGAGMGAIAGAGAATIGVLATRGHETYVGPESVLTFRIQNPVTIDGTNEAFTPVTQQDYDQHPRQMQQRYAYGPRPPVAPYPAYGYYGYGYPYPYYGFYPGFFGPSFYFYSGPRFYHGGGFYHGGYRHR